MPSLVDRRSGPFSGRSFSVNGFSMVPTSDFARFVFRARGIAVDKAGRAFGVEMPRQALRTNAADARVALWMGPDEWLLLAPESEEDLVERQLKEALVGIAHSLVDVSHRDAALILSGANSAVALSAGCPLDLHPSVFTVGVCTRTLLAKTQIVLWHSAPQQFHLQVSRSFAQYVWQFLEQAAHDVDY